VALASRLAAGGTGRGVSVEHPREKKVPPGGASLSPISKALSPGGTEVIVAGRPDGRKRSDGTAKR